MIKQLLPPVERESLSPAQPLEIGRGNHGAIQLDPDSMVVSKQLSMDDPERAATLVRREYSYLGRLSDVLREERYLSCPSPVSMEPENGIVRMSFCPGERLDFALSEGNPAVLNEIDHIAEQIAIGLTRYVAEFGEPCFSLSTNNLVFDPSSRVLYMIDFTSGRTIQGVDPGEVPFDVTLGCFLGVTTYHTVRIRPAMWRRRDYWQRQRRFSVAVLRALSATREISPDLIRCVAHDTYRMLAINGRPLRRLWYSSTGRLLFSRRLDETLTRVTRDSGSVRAN